MTDLAELKRLLERATPGPWRAAGFEISASTSYGEDIYLRASKLYGAGGEANAEVVAALRNAAPALIAELEAARECVTELRGLSNDAESWCDECGPKGPCTGCWTGAPRKALAAYDAATGATKAESGGGNAD